MAKVDKNLFKKFLNSKKNDPIETAILVVIASFILGAIGIGLLSLLYFFTKAMFVLLFFLIIVGGSGYGLMVWVAHLITQAEVRKKVKNLKEERENLPFKDK